MKSKRITRLVAVGALCALVGTGAGIAGSSAATKSSSRSAHAREADGPAGLRRGGPPVHAEVVALNKAGTGFVTVTEDNGTVKSVSDDQLTITESARKADGSSVTYKDTTLTLPSDAKLRRNGETASLSDLRAGDHVHVASSSDGTFVDAFDSSHRPPHGPGGPPPGGPPPGAPRQR
jgi:hypothetical protein